MHKLHQFTIDLSWGCQISFTHCLLLAICLFKSPFCLHTFSYIVNIHVTIILCLKKYLFPSIHIIECVIANCENFSTSYLPPIWMNVVQKVPMMLLQNIENNTCFCLVISRFWFFNIIKIFLKIYFRFQGFFMISCIYVRYPNYVKC